MFEPPRRSPPAASDRSACRACMPLPRSTSVKQLDLRTNTLISASGEPRPASRHQSDSGLGSPRSEEHTSELQSPCNLVCRLLLEKKKTKALSKHVTQIII